MNKKRCQTCECYDCDCEECSCDCHHNDRVSLIVMIETQVINQTQRFQNIDRCLYFAERLTKQPMIPSEEGDKRITAYCKPVNK